MILIILASGRGSRLGKVTNTKPKCLINIYKNKTLIDYLSEKFELFSKVIVVTGYKSKILKKKLNSKKIIFVENKKYQNTNMVESLMLCKTLINNDLIISYADIFYDGNILRKLNKLKGNFLPVNKNWLNSWKKRYGSLAEIKNDAEDLVTKNKKIISLSGKIKNKIPKYQYMGIIKLTKQSFIKLHNYYKALKKF